MADNFSNLELHYGATSGKLDVQYAYRFPGGKGDGIRVAVLDTNFPAHEDLPTVTMVGDTTNALTTDDHGTLSAGIIAAKHDGSGFNGIAPNVTLYGGILRADRTLNTHLNIRAAADALSAGDVLYIATQRGGPLFQNGQGELGTLGAIPFEWWPDDYDAIRYATQKGIIVVSIAGNGDSSLDDSAYNTPPTGAPAWWRNPFDRALADSGSILVGAASPGQPRATNLGVLGSRLGFSNYGASLDASFWGREMTVIKSFQNTTNAPGNWYYTDGTGTSVAAPAVVGVIACLQGALRAAGRPLATPDGIRRALRATGYSQQTGTYPSTQRIGSMVSIKGLFDYFALTPPAVVLPTTPSTRPTHSGLNLAQLMEKVYQFTSREAVEDGRIVDLLNEGAEEISRLTTAPTMEVRIQGVTGPFRPRVALPDGTSVDVDYNGILEAHAHYGNYEGAYQGGGHRVPLRTTSDASRYHPDWRLNKQGLSSGNYEWADGRPLQYIIYDPVNLTAELTPMPNPVVATDIYLKLHVRPKRMVERTDVPLNGEFASYHDAVAEYAIFILANQLLEGEAAIQKGNFHYNRFKQLTDRMISAARPEPVYAERESPQFREPYY